MQHWAGMLILGASLIGSVFALILFAELSWFFVVSNKEQRRAKVDMVKKLGFKGTMRKVFLEPEAPKEDHRGRPEAPKEDHRDDREEHHRHSAATHG